MLKYWKHLAAAFAVCLVLVLLTQPAEAAGGQQGAFTYELKGNGTAVITKFDWSKYSGGDVYVPRSIDGYQVTTIGKMAFSAAIEEDAVANSFNGDIDISESDLLGNAVAIILPDTITMIEEKAFFWTKITACDIPASVQIIEPGAFAGCVNIRQFSVNSGNRTYAVIDGVLFNKAKKELVAFPFNCDTGDYRITRYTIPNGIKSIGEYAFYCVGRRINGLHYNSPFKLAKPLDIMFPETLNTINDYAFWGAEFDETASSILQAKHIGNYAFAYCALPELDFRVEIELGVTAFASPQTIGDYAFYFSGYMDNKRNRSVEISCENLESLGIGAFMRSKKLKASHFGASQLAAVPSYAFYDLKYKSSDYFPTDLPSTVQTIGEYAFANNANFSLQIPASVKEIKANAFSESKGATISFADDSSLKSIGERAFYEFTTTSSEIVLPEGVETIGMEAFYTSTNKGVALLNVPASVTTIGEKVVNRAITVMQVEPGSYADIWASENGFPIQVDDTSWLFE